MSDPLLNFYGKVVLITGGSTGIGRATAMAFAVRVAKVVVGDVNDAGSETIDLLKAAGGNGLFVRTNVADSVEVQALIKKTVDTFGGCIVPSIMPEYCPPPCRSQIREMTCTTESWRSTFGACSCASSMKYAIC